MDDLKTHRAVLKEWQERPPHATETFVSDGPIDPDRWLKIERQSTLSCKGGLQG